MARIDEIANHAEESEKSIEAYLVKSANELKGKALKFYNPSEVGYPDRLLILPHCIPVWIEIKSKGKKPRPIQLLRHKELRELGCVVEVADSKRKIDEIIGNTLRILRYE